ncbi:MAG: diguanylate cyclase, partial [Terriglobales bacterium]
YVAEPQAGGALEPHIVHVTASIGIAGGDVIYEHGEELLHDADMAMYRAKSEGTGGFAVFEPSPQVATSRM